MKSPSRSEMDVVPAPLLPTPSAALAHELHSMLGPIAEARLRHLMDGRPVHAAGLRPGAEPVTDASRSPRVRFLAGPLHVDEATGRCYGPVLPEGEPGRATYVEPDHLAHHDCSTCAPTWLSAASLADGFVLDEFEVVPGVAAMIAVPPGVPSVPDGELRTA